MLAALRRPRSVHLRAVLASRLRGPRLWWAAWALNSWLCSLPSSLVLKSLSFTLFASSMWTLCGLSARDFSGEGGAEWDWRQ